MRLAEFIMQNSEAILADWEAFAATLLPAAKHMSPHGLRDHAKQILEAVAIDLDTPQSADAQAQKSKGRAPKVADAPETAAQTHAVLRAKSGFDINQLVAEYRALRASVLKLWMDAGPLDRDGVQDIVRFNEAIDQAVSESVSHFHAQVERARNLLLGMLGHDMRSPLLTIQATASCLASLGAGEEVSVAASRLIRSGAAMQSLLDDLVDFNRTRLGLGIRISPVETDLASVVADELEQLRGAYPDRQIDFVVGGECRGSWDGVRVQQMLRNLVSNAIRYGSPEAPVRVVIHCDDADVRLEVTNRGGKIKQSDMGRIFEPLNRGGISTALSDGDGGLGLGLFIVREIAHAHGGEAEVRSGGPETSFVVRLPRTFTRSSSGAIPAMGNRGH